MTGRERLTAILHGRPADRLSWTTLVDGATLNALPPGLRGMPALDFYRHVGCDVLLLNGWGTGHSLSSPQLRWPDEVEQRAWDQGEERLLERRTPGGALLQVTRGGHPVRYPVTTPEELRLYRAMWEGAQFVERDDRAAFGRIDAEVGDDGVVTRFWGPSTIPRLLQYEMGAEGFYYLLSDCAQEMEGLISLMHERELEAFRILARGPWDVVILCENTNTAYISPEVYRRYNGPHVRDFVETMHAAGKIAIIHMCGHIRGLLGMIRETGLDGVHALTPPPTGDTPWELALDELGEDLIIIGILDPTVFVSGPLGEIGPALDGLFTPRLRRANFVLWPAADGIEVPLERFQAVAAWMENNA